MVLNGPPLTNAMSFPILSDPVKPWYTIELNGISVNGKPITGISLPSYAIIDTGTEGLAFPGALFYAVFAEVLGAMSSSCLSPSGLLANNITFTLAGQQVDVPFLSLFSSSDLWDPSLQISTQGNVILGLPLHFQRSVRYDLINQVVQIGALSTNWTCS